MPVFNPTEHIGKQSGGSPLTPGEYQVFITDMNIRDGKAAPYYYVKMKVCTGKQEGRQITDTVSTSERAYWKLAEFCHSFGYRQSFDPIDGFDMLRAAAMNNQRPITITLEFEKSNNPDDSPRLRVKKFHWDPDLKESNWDQGGSPEDEVDDIPF